jgi:hypothetical protein
MPDNSYRRDARGRLVFEMFGVPAGSYPSICADLIESFHLEPVGTLVSDLEALTKPLLA